MSKLRSEKWYFCNQCLSYVNKIKYKFVLRKMKNIFAQSAQDIKPKTSVSSLETLRIPLKKFLAFYKVFSVDYYYFTQEAIVDEENDHDKPFNLT